VNNEGFETSSRFLWISITPNGHFIGIPGGQVDMTSLYTGSYHSQDKYETCANKISQQIVATAEQICIVSFWLSSDAITFSMLVHVTLS